MQPAKIALNVSLSSSVTFGSIERFVLSDFTDIIDVAQDLTGAKFYGGGGGGGDSIDWYTNGSTVYGGAGNDTIWGDILYGNEGKDAFYAGGGNDVFFVWKGDDKLFGGKGDDQFFGGEGRDLMKGGDGANFFEMLQADQPEKVWGGCGADTFVFDDVDFQSAVFNGNGSSKTIIYDFSGNDVIRFLDLITGDITLMPHSFGEMLNHSEQTAKGVEIEFKTGNVLLLMGVDMDDLSRSNFEFSFN